MSVALASSELLVRESLFGLGVMFIAMTLNVYVFASIAMLYQNRLQKSRYLGTLVRYGIPILIHSDAPVSAPSPLKETWTAVTRKDI